MKFNEVITRWACLTGGADTVRVNVRRKSDLLKTIRKDPLIYRILYPRDGTLSRYSSQGSSGSRCSCWERPSTIFLRSRLFTIRERDSKRGITVESRGALGWASARIKFMSASIYVLHRFATSSPSRWQLSWIQDTKGHYHLGKYLVREHNARSP